VLERVIGVGRGDKTAIVSRSMTDNSPRDEEGPAGEVLLTGIRSNGDAALHKSGNFPLAFYVKIVKMITI
jgi:hypothetical protein